MSALTETVTFWLNDPRLRQCSATSFRLWMRLLPLMYESDCPGFLQSNGLPLSAEQLGQQTDLPADEVARCLQELTAAGVACVTDAGPVHCRVLRTEFLKVSKRNSGRGGRPPKTKLTESVSQTTDSVNLETDSVVSETDSVSEINRVGFQKEPSRFPTPEKADILAHSLDPPVLPDAERKTSPVCVLDLSSSIENKSNTTQHPPAENPPEEPAGFVAFWSAWPWRTRRPEALAAWIEKVTTPELQDKILAAVARHLQSSAWRNARKVNYAHLWLKRGQWDDEPPPITRELYDRDQEPRTGGSLLPARPADSRIAAEIALEFSRILAPNGHELPSPTDITRAETLLAEIGDYDKARAVLPVLAKVARDEWPEIKRLGGAIQFLPEALKLLDAQKHSDKQAEEKERQRLRDAERAEEHARVVARQEALWKSLTDAQREAIRGIVSARLLSVFGRSADRAAPQVVRGQCLKLAAETHGLPIEVPEKA